MFNEAEDKKFLPSKPVVKPFHQGKNFPCIILLCESKGTYVNPPGFKAPVSIFTPLASISWDMTGWKTSGICLPNLFQILVVVIHLCVELWVHILAMMSMSVEQNPKSIFWKHNASRDSRWCLLSSEVGCWLLYPWLTHT